MKIQPEFPPHRRKGSKGNGDPIAYDQFADCGLPGHALNELKPLSEAPELDFVVWVEDIGRLDIEVKGGTYSTRETV